MPQLTISDSDTVVLSNALHIAAGRFHENAVKFRCQIPRIAREERENPLQRRDLSSEAAEQLANRFDYYELEALSLAEKIGKQLTPDD